MCEGFSALAGRERPWGEPFPERLREAAVLAAPETVSKPALPPAALSRSF